MQSFILLRHVGLTRGRLNEEERKNSSKVTRQVDGIGTALYMRFFCVGSGRGGVSPLEPNATRVKVLEGNQMNNELVIVDKIIYCDLARSH